MRIQAAVVGTRRTKQQPPKSMFGIVPDSFQECTGKNMDHNRRLVRLA